MLPDVRTLEQSSEIIIAWRW